VRHWVKLRKLVERYKVPKGLNQGLRVRNGLRHGFLSIIVSDCLGFGMLPLLGSHLAKGGYQPNYYA
jgi:hypothetical protein